MSFKDLRFKMGRFCRKVSKVWSNQIKANLNLNFAEMRIDFLRILIEGLVLILL